MYYTKIFTFLYIFIASIGFADNISAQTNAPGEGQIDFRFAPVPIYPPGGDLPSLKFQTDGKILATGRFDPNQNAANRLARFLPNGQRDTGFNAPTPFRVDAFAIQSNGKIICSSTFLDSQQYQIISLVRLNTDGSLDSTFNFNFVAQGVVTAIAILPDDRILIGGNILEKVENPVSKNVARLSANGEIDRTFSADGNESVIKLIPLANGKIMVLNSFTSFKLRRLNADGSPDPTFTENTDISNFFLQPGGKIIAVSRSSSDLKRLDASGALDPTFQAQHTLRPFNSIAVQTDGKILLNSCGLCVSNTRMQYEKLDANGALIQRFSSYLLSGSIYLSPSNEIYLSGNLALGNKNNGIVRLRSNYTPTRRKAFDFDGDGKSDIAVYRPSNGVWYVLNSATNTFSFVNFGLAGDKPVSADYDGDGRADIAVYRPSTGVWYRLFSSNGQFDAVRFGISEDIPTQEDYDGDGRADISLFRPSTGVWYRLNSANGSFTAVQYGLTGDKPLAGDYDGDGRADFAVYRPSDSVWYRFLTGDNSYKSDYLGYYDGNLGAPADYDGDGRLDMTYYQDLTGYWYGLKSATNQGIYLQWGVSSDIPVPADYDGDGRDDFAVWRPSSGVWWIINSTNGSYTSYQFGASGDIPVQAAYVR